MEKLERREDVDAYIQNLVYSLYAQDSPIFEGLVEREVDHIVAETSLDAQTVMSMYAPNVVPLSIFDTVSTIQANVDDPVYPVIEGSDEWYEFHDSVMSAFDSYDKGELVWFRRTTFESVSTDDLVQKFSE